MHRFLLRERGDTRRNERPIAALGERRTDNLPRGVGRVHAGRSSDSRALPCGTYYPRFPTVPVSACVEVVLAYRCGAVPALHRVPFSANAEASNSASAP